MQEFSSISVSSYEAGSLAERLTAQSSDGWSVVAIVPTGSTITAYLSREAAGDGEPAADSAGTETTGTGTAAAVAAAEPSPALVERAPEPAAADTASWSALAEQAAEAEAPTPEPSIPEIRLPETTAPAAAAADPVSEPGGWAVAPESAGSSSSSASTDPTIGLGASSGAASIAAAAEEVAATPAAAEPAAQAEQAQATQQVAQQSQATQAAAATAPAGWYADPSSRYELRYWDGTQWTEHVSRGGQQFTDPPVA